MRSVLFFTTQVDVGCGGLHMNINIQWSSLKGISYLLTCLSTPKCPPSAQVNLVQYFLHVTSGIFASSRQLAKFCQLLYEVVAAASPPRFVREGLLLYDNNRSPYCLYLRKQQCSRTFPVPYPALRRVLQATQYSNPLQKPQPSTKINKPHSFISPSTWLPSPCLPLQFLWTPFP